MGKASEAWAVELNAAFIEEMGGVKKAVVYVATEAVDKVIRRSPVGNPDLWRANQGKTRGDPGWQGKGYVGGHFRANWVMSIGSQNLTEIGTVDASGETAIAAAYSILSAYPEGEWPVIYLQNNLPYAEALEHGHSSQAPTGMVGLTTIELEALIQGLET